MSTKSRYLIKFKHRDLAYLRARLLEDLSKEHFAVLLGKTQKFNGYTIIKVIDLLFPGQSDYHQQSVAFLRIKKDFIHKALVELTNRYDVDTIIDVHTHPFTQGSVSFSATDDGDEKTFYRFLKEKFAGINYASIVFSQRKYSARVWTFSSGSTIAKRALLKTQTSRENIASADFHEDADEHSAKTAVTGVEDLIHMGFHEINLIDPDVLELSNLNRVVGAYYKDAQQKLPKVDVVKRHLTNINPNATVTAYKSDVHDKEIERVLALSDWMIVATDNHSSRLRTQELSIKYFVPLVSLGVNISVKDNKIEDMSGEVITARVGDYLCLHCLNRINPIKVASERHPDRTIREALVT